MIFFNFPENEDSNTENVKPAKGVPPVGRKRGRPPKHTSQTPLPKNKSRVKEEPEETIVSESTTSRASAEPGEKKKF